MTDVNFPQDFYLDDVGVWRLKKEKLTELEKPKPQTNEEYIKSLDTEQLADVLWEQINGAFNSGYACCNLKQDKDYVGRYKRFKEWLKQPHQKE